MRNLAVRVALAGLFVAAGGVAAYLLWACEARARRESQTFRSFDEAAIAAGRETLELRAAQEAYVAAGQGEPFWIQQTAALTASLREKLATLRAAGSSPGTQSALDNAAAALEEFEQLDRRARDYARNGEKLLASDLIFADGLEIISGIAGSIDQGRSIEARSRDAGTAALRRIELAAVGGFAAIGAAAVLLLTPRPRPVEATAPADSASPAPAAAPAPATAPSDSDLPLSVDRLAPAAVAPAETASAPAVDIETIAKLCGDLARVDDTRALPAILERAAAVLDARGIVLWIADPDGRELNPIVTHGYPQAVIARLGTIAGDAENATASAFRTGMMQTVLADAVSDGAIAAPLVTPGGCVGVMAAEVRARGEQDSGKLAAAAIIAAQLAMLAGPPSTRAPVRSEAV